MPLNIRYPLPDLSKLLDLKNPHELANIFEQHIKSVSDRLKAHLAKLDGAKLVFDVIGIGAGLNNCQSFAALREANPEISTLVLEANFSMSVFDQLGDSFAVNSVEIPGTSEYDYKTANFFSATPVQVQDYNVNRDTYVSAQVFADTIKTAFYYSETPILFGELVVAVTENDTTNPANARYKITTASGFCFYANHIIAGTGLGIPKTLNADPQAQKLIAQHKIKADLAVLNNLDYTPGIETVDAYLHRLAKRAKLGLDTQETGPIAVVGGKDGSNIAIEALAGITKSLNVTSSEVNIIWVGQCKDKTDFINQYFNNPQERWSPFRRNEVRFNRYSGIIPLLDNGTILPVPGHLEQIIEVQLPQKDRKPRAAFQITVNGKVIIVDRVILAIGYDNKVDAIFGKFAPHGTEKQYSDTGNCTLNTLQQGVFPVARKYTNQNIWVVGAACDGWSDKIFEADHWPLTDGGGAVDILGTRSAALGRLVAESCAKHLNRQKSGKLKLDAELQWHSYQLPDSAHRAETINSVNIPVIQIVTKILLARILNKFVVNVPQSYIGFSIGHIRNNNLNVIAIFGLQDASAQLLLQHIMQDKHLLSMLQILIMHGNKIYFETSNRDDGSFRIENTCTRIIPKQKFNRLSARL